jgi:hypothetical protein
MWVIISKIQLSDQETEQVVVLSYQEGRTRTFTTQTEAKEWAEENTNVWYKVVSV